MRLQDVLAEPLHEKVVLVQHPDGKGRERLLVTHDTHAPDPITWDPAAQQYDPEHRVYVEQARRVWERGLVFRVYLQEFRVASPLTPLVTGPVPLEDVAVEFPGRWVDMDEVGEVYPDDYRTPLHLAADRWEGWTVPTLADRTNV